MDLYKTSILCFFLYPNLMLIAIAERVLLAKNEQSSEKVPYTGNASISSTEKGIENNTETKSPKQRLIEPVIPSPAIPNTNDVKIPENSGKNTTLDANANKIGARTSEERYKKRRSADETDTNRRPLGIFDAISNRLIRIIQSDFNFLIRCCAVISSLTTQLVPLHTILEIKYNKSTGKLKIVTFVTMAFSNILWSIYGLASSNTVIMLSNIPGTLLSLCYVSTFKRYCQDYQQLHILNIFYKVFMGVSLTLLSLYLYLAAETFLSFIGLFGGTLLAISYLAPLFSFREIISSKSTSVMPAEISLANFFGSFFMLCYGFIIWDYLVIAPNFCGVVGGMIQITLLILFPRNDRIIVSEVGILEGTSHFRPLSSPELEIC